MNLKNKTIFFLGDSITDCLHNEDEKKLGDGYVKIINDYFLENNKDDNIKLINSGISGHRTTEILLRLEEELETYKPNIITVLAGVNDSWRRFDQNLITTDETFKQNYEKIINMCLDSKPEALIILSPFILDTTDFSKEIRTDLTPKHKIVISLAKKYNLPYVDLQKVFDSALKNATMDELLYDGVHPSQLGHSLIFKNILEKLEEIY